MAALEGKLTRIGIFYDGNFFFHVSNYYHYHHERRARISISGLHSFVRQQVADCEKCDPRYCQIVDAHYFRGRLRAADAEDRDLLYKERVFDDVLVREGVTTHYLPLTREGEKGIDVWLALEAYEMAIYKSFDVVVLVVCDGDFLPLVRKLNTLGTRVMVLGWDFRYFDANGNERETRTAQVLLDEVTYPIMMHPIIEDRARQRDQLINGLFVPRKESGSNPMIPRPAFLSPSADRRDAAPTTSGPANSGTVNTGTINGGTVNGGSVVAPVHGGGASGWVQTLKSGYGFIVPDQGGPNLFFFHEDVSTGDFLELKIGDRVHFVLGQNDRGPCAKEVRRFGAGID
jgi:cold shock CspA family protein